MEMTALHAAAKHQHAARGGEVPVHAVILRLRDRVGHDNGRFQYLLGLAFDDHVAAELACQDDERAIEQSALLEVAYELRDGTVDRLLERHGACVAIFVRIPVQKWNVFGGDFDEAGAGLAQAPREQAAEAEAADHLRLVLRAKTVARRFNRLSRRS